MDELDGELSMDRDLEVTQFRCASCGNEGAAAPLTIKETFGAYHPVHIRGGKFVVEHASRRCARRTGFDDGASDYAAHCWRVGVGVGHRGPRLGPELDGR